MNVHYIFNTIIIIIIFFLVNHELILKLRIYMSITIHISFISSQNSLHHRRWVTKNIKTIQWLRSHFRQCINALACRETPSKGSCNQLEVVPLMNFQCHCSKGSQHSKHQVQLLAAESHYREEGTLFFFFPSLMQQSSPFPHHQIKPTTKTKPTKEISHHTNQSGASRGHHHLLASLRNKALTFRNELVYETLKTLYAFSLRNSVRVAKSIPTLYHP